MMDDAGAPQDPAAPRRGRHRIPLSNRLGQKTPVNWKVLAISLVAAVAATAMVFTLASMRAKARMERSGHFDDEVVIDPGRTFSYIVSTGMDSSYSFGVKPLNGDVFMAFGRVDDGATNFPTEDDVEKALDERVKVESGKSKRLSGSMPRGRYTWAVINPSTHKPVRVVINFD
jgi:hypothetical protein